MLAIPCQYNGTDPRGHVITDYGMGQFPGCDYGMYQGMVPAWMAGGIVMGYAADGSLVAAVPQLAFVDGCMPVMTADMLQRQVAMQQFPQQTFGLLQLPPLYQHQAWGVQPSQQPHRLPTSELASPPVDIGGSGINSSSKASAKIFVHDSDGELRHVALATCAGGGDGDLGPVEVSLLEEELSMSPPSRSAARPTRREWCTQQSDSDSADGDWEDWLAAGPASPHRGPTALPAPSSLARSGRTRAAGLRVLVLPPAPDFAPPALPSEDRRAASSGAVGSGACAVHDRLLISQRTMLQRRRDLATIHPRRGMRGPSTTEKVVESRSPLEFNLLRKVLQRGEAFQPLGSPESPEDTEQVDVAQAPEDTEIVDSDLGQVDSSTTEALSMSDALDGRVPELCPPSAPPMRMPLATCEEAAAAEVLSAAAPQAAARRGRTAAAASGGGSRSQKGDQRRRRQPASTPPRMPPAPAGLREESTGLSATAVEQLGDTTTLEFTVFYQASAATAVPLRLAKSMLLRSAARGSALSGAHPVGALAALLFLFAVVVTLVVTGLALLPAALASPGPLDVCQGDSWTLSSSSCTLAVPAFQAGSSTNVWLGIDSLTVTGDSTRSIGALVKRLEVEAARAIAAAQRPKLTADSGRRRKQRKQVFGEV